MLPRISRLLFGPLHTRLQQASGMPFRPIIRAEINQQGQRQYYRTRYQRFQRTQGILAGWAVRPTFLYEVVGLGALVGGAYIYNVETVPVSGRRRFNIVSGELEISMAKEAYAEVMHQYRHQMLPSWDRRTQRVQRVLNRLIPASGLTDQQWEVHVIDSGEKNAFVLPGGKVFVFTGILPVAKDDDGLATVLGHEIAHNVGHHFAERLTRGLMLYAFSWLQQLFTGSPGQLGQILSHFIFSLPNGRKQETEADYIGLLMMAQSCYDPRAAPELWKRMEQAEQAAPPEFISTHPSSHNRGERMREWLPEALSKREASDCASVLNYADDFRKVYEQLRW